MTSVSSPPSRRPNTRRKQCLCGNWFSVKPERDRYCSKACALVDSWNTLVAGESHYRREMAARETMRAVSAKRVASSRTLRTPEVTAAITVGQYSGPADQASHYGAFDKAGSHRARPAAGDALPKPRKLRRVQSTMHLFSLARCQPSQPLDTFSPAPSHRVRQDKRRV